MAEEKSETLLFKSSELFGVSILEMFGGDRKKVFDRNIKNLFKKYEVELGNWKFLALRMASKYEASFAKKRKRKKAGMKKEWNTERQVYLLNDIIVLKRNRPSLSAQSACKHLAEKHPYWKNKISPSSLYAAYNRYVVSELLNAPELTADELNEILASRPNIAKRNLRKGVYKT